MRRNYDVIAGVIAGAIFIAGQIAGAIAGAIFIAGQIAGVIAGAIFIAGQIAPAITPEITANFAPGGFRTKSSRFNYLNQLSRLTTVYKR